MFFSVVDLSIPVLLVIISRISGGLGGSQSPFDALEKRNNSYPRRESKLGNFKSSFIGDFPSHSVLLVIFLLHLVLLAIFLLHPVLSAIFLLHPVLSAIFLLHPVLLAIFLLHPVLSAIFLLHPVLSAIFLLHPVLSAIFLLHPVLLAIFLLQPVLSAIFLLHCLLLVIFLLQQSGDRILVGARFSAPVQTGPEAHPASCAMGTGSFPGVRCGRDVTLTPHPLLVARSKIE